MPAHLNLEHRNSRLTFAQPGRLSRPEGGAWAAESGETQFEQTPRINPLTRTSAFRSIWPLNHAAGDNANAPAGSPER